MKKFIFVIVFTLSLFAADIPWVYDFDKAKTLAKEQDKVVMMFLSQKRCPACNYAKKRVFPEKNVAKFMEENMIMYHVDIETDKVPKGYSYIGTPTTYFLRSDGTIIGERFMGIAKPEGYMKILRYYMGLK